MRLTLIFFIFISQRVQSAPWPGTSSSAVFSSDYNFLLTFEKINLSTKGLNWSMGENIHRWKQKNGNGQLLLSFDRLQSQSNIGDHQKKWIKEYLSYGFEVLNQKPFIHQNKIPAQLFDLIHKERNKQVRQYIFQTKQQIAIFTCTDYPSQFRTTVTECNQIIRTFMFDDLVDISPSVMQNK